jgi:hypothetical protein
VRELFVFYLGIILFLDDFVDVLDCGEGFLITD